MVRIKLAAPALGAWLGVAAMAGSMGAVSAAADEKSPPGPKTEIRGAAPPLADPQFIEQYTATRGFTLGRPAEVRFANNDRHVLFLRSGARSFVRDLYEYDTQTQQARALLTADQILRGGEEKLTVEEAARRERMRSTARGIASFEVSKDGALLLVPLSGRLFSIERSTGAVRELPAPEGAAVAPQFSPDGSQVACVRNGDLYVHNVATGATTRLTDNADATHANGVAEFVAQEEMGRFAGFWWSPDGTRLAYQHNDESAVEEWRIADPLRPGQPPNTFRYPRPGKANVDVRLGIVPAAGGTTTWVEWDREEFPYLATVQWSENAPLTLLVQNRRQTVERLLAVEEGTGQARLLLEETDAAWLNLDQGMPRWLKDGKSFLWTTERGGAWQLELRDATGKLVRTLTPPEFGLRKLTDVDHANGCAYVTAATDPREEHVFRVPIDPAHGGPVQLTHDPGIHRFEFDAGFGMHVHAQAGRDGNRRLEIVAADGRSLGEIPSIGEEPPFMPDLELTTVGAAPHMHAAIVRPRDFSAERRYPIVVYVYGGPHAQMVTAQPFRYLLHQWFADHGFIVVSLDGRGTPNRGRDWERAIRGNFIETPLADQVAGLKALGEKYPEMDLARVAIFGWSFGGYFSTMAIARRPDVYHAAVAGAPVIDWHDYDTHYTERYLGLPQENGEGYEKSGVLPYARDLRRPLLLIHGTADDNVYFSHSLKLEDALFKAGIDHQFLPLPGQTHMVADPATSQRMYERIMRFFANHLKPGE